MITTEIFKIVEDKFCKTKLSDEKKQYESHLYTQGIVRRYISGVRNNEAGSLIKILRDAANKEINNQKHEVTDSDLDIMQLFLNSGLKCKIIESHTLLGKTIDIVVNKFIFNGELRENTRFID